MKSLYDREIKSVSDEQRKSSDTSLAGDLKNISNSAQESVDKIPCRILEYYTNTKFIPAKAEEEKSETSTLSIYGTENGFRISYPIYEKENEHDQSDEETTSSSHDTDDETTGEEQSTNHVPVDQIKDEGEQIANPGKKNPNKRDKDFAPKQFTESLVKKVKKRKTPLSFNSKTCEEWLNKIRYIVAKDTIEKKLKENPVISNTGHNLKKLSGTPEFYHQGKKVQIKLFEMRDPSATRMFFAKIDKELYAIGITNNHKHNINKISTKAMNQYKELHMYQQEQNVTAAPRLS